MNSADADKVKEYLASKQFSFATEIHIQPSAGTVLISVPESAIAATSTEKTTSWRKLSLLKQQITADLGIVADFLLVRDAIQNQIESGLNALLITKFRNKVKEAYLSFNNESMYDVWLDLVESAEIDQAQRRDIRSAAEEFLDLFECKLGLVQATTPEAATPTLGQILREAKKLAPADSNVLFNVLQKAGFTVPSPFWVERKLDTMRKRLLLIRFADGRYSLTEEGLKTVPHSKTRTSSDVERALALGRRIW